MTKKQYKRQAIHWGELKKKDKILIEKKGKCGATFLMIPQFCFKASCSQHDFYYRRGGNLADKMRADIQFYSAMLFDCTELIWYKMIFLFTMATIYFIMVSVFGILFFTFGKYKTKTQILKSFK